MKEKEAAAGAAGCAAEQHQAEPREWPHVF